MSELGEGGVLVFYRAAGKVRAKLGKRLVENGSCMDWSLYRDTRLPENIREELSKLNEVLPEKTIYEVADQIAGWMEDASTAEENNFAIHLNNLSTKGSHILLSALADAEVQIGSEQLLHTIAGFLRSDDKRLAQSSAVCLLRCGGTLGEKLLRVQLWNPDSLPHVQLILGTINLLASP